MSTPLYYIPEAWSPTVLYLLSLIWRVKKFPIFKMRCFAKCDALQNFVFNKTRIDPREFPQLSRIWWIRHRNPQLFWICSPEWKFLNTLGYGIVWTLNPTSHDRAQFFTLNIQDGAEHNVIPSLLLELRPVSRLITCVQPSYDYCTLQLCQTAVRHFEASFHVGRTNWTP